VVQIFHSTTGGSGAGLLACILSYFSDEYSGILSHGLAIALQSNIFNNTIEIYNLVLGFSHLIEKDTLVNLFQNECLNRICYNDMNILRPRLRDMISIISRIATALTQPMRFSGSLNTSFRKICTNLIPFTRLHFTLAGLAPLNSVKNGCRVSSLIDTAYGPTSFMTEVDWHEGRFFTTAYLFSDAGLSNLQVSTALLDFKRKNESNYYTSWIHDSSHCSVIQLPTDRPSLVTLMNSSSVRVLLLKFASSFTAMLRRKAFLFHYIMEGMDEVEFTEAKSHLNDLTYEFPEGIYYDDMIYDEPDF
jgi:tubulin beta